MLRILNEDLKTVQTIPKFLSLIWTSRFTEAGNFRLQISSDVPYRIEESAVLFIRYQEYYGMIQYIHADDECVELRGYDLKGLMILRRALPQSYSGTLESVIKSIVADNLQGVRGFPHFVIAEDQKRGEEISYTIDKPDTLENVLKKLCEKYDVGYDIIVQNGEMVFDMVQPETSEHVYSERRRNVTAWEYTDDRLSEENTELLWCAPLSYEAVDCSNAKYKFLMNGKLILQGGVYEVKDLETEVFSTIPIKEREYYLILAKANDDGTISSRVYYLVNTGYTEIGKVWINSKGVPEALFYPSFLSFDASGTETGVSGFLRKETTLEASGTEIPYDEIRESLTEQLASEFVSAEIADGYREQWKIGDYLKIKICLFGQWLSVERQVTEVEETFEANNRKIAPVFGRQKDNIIRKLQKGRI